MPFSNYTDLQTSIQSFLDNDNPNLVAAIPDMIALAEAWFNRHLHTRDQECRTSTPLTPVGVTEDELGIYALPADWGGQRAVERSGNDLVLLYWRKIPNLSDANPTNWLLAKYPDLYLHASLSNAESWLKNDPRIALWAQSSVQTLKEVEEHDVHDKYSGNVLRSRTPSNIPWKGTSDGTLEYLKPGDFFDMEASNMAIPTFYPGYFTTVESTVRILPKPSMPS